MADPIVSLAIKIYLEISRPTNKLACKKQRDTFINYVYKKKHKNLCEN